MKSLFIVVILSVFVSSICFAVGAPDYLPNGAHPRIWLNAETIANLNALQDTNDPRWTNLESWCDSHLNDRGYDAGDQNWSGDNNFVSYRMAGFRKYLGNFSLAYQVLKDDSPVKAATYAAYVRNILIDGIVKGLKAGEEDNGLNAIRSTEAGDPDTINDDEATAFGIAMANYKGGYESRHTQAAVTAYDWIYDTLSAGDKTLIHNMLLRFADYHRAIRSTYNNGVLKDGIRYYEDTDGVCDLTHSCTDKTGIAVKAYAFDNMGNNFAAGEAMLMIETAIALYGESLDANTLYTWVRDDYVPNYLMAAYDSDVRLSGGDSGEGRTYWGGFEFSVAALYAYQQATGKDVLSSGNWPLSLEKTYIHTLFPDLYTIPIYGDPQVHTGTSVVYNGRVFCGVNSYLNPSAEETGVLKHLLDTKSYPGNVYLYEALLWDNKTPTASVQSPSDAGLPPFYYAKGTGLVTMRSSWEDTTDTVFSMIRLEGKLEAAHENYDEGAFWLSRGSVRLIHRVGDANYQQYSSSISFDNDKTYRYPNVTTEFVGPIIDRITNTSDYVYVRGDLSDLFDGDQWNGHVAEKFIRSYLFIRPNIFIVSDITKSYSDNSNEKSWNTQYEVDPSVSGNTITVINSGQKATVTTLYPTNGTYIKTYQSGYGGNYRVQYSVNSTPYDQFLHVVEATGSADTPTVTSLITGSYVRGAKVGNTAAMFTSNQDGNDVQSATYTVDATIHYIADLPINTLIDVTRNGSTIVTDLNSGSAGIIEFRAASGTAEYIMTAGNYIEPPATCSDGIQNQDETGIDCGGICPSCASDRSGDVSIIVPPTLRIN